MVYDLYSYLANVDTDIIWSVDLSVRGASINGVIFRRLAVHVIRRIRVHNDWSA